VDLLEALLLAACFAVIEIHVSSFQIPHFEVTIESLIHVLIRNDPRKENRKLYPLLYSENTFDFPSHVTLIKKELQMLKHEFPPPPPLLNHVARLVHPIRQLDP